MQLREIKPKTMDEFVLNSPKAHFMQTSAWGEVCAKRNYLIHHLGLFDNETLVATALFLEKKILNFRTFYCPRGFVCDYANRTIVRNMIDALKDYTRKHNGLYFKMDPDIIIARLNKDSEPIQTFDENRELIDFFIKNGGKHKGFTTDFSTANPRYTFRVDVTKEDLIASFHQTTRNIIKRNNPYHLHFYKGDKKDVELFYTTMKETSLRKKMYLEPYSFFDNFYSTLNKHDMSDVYIVYALKSELLDIYHNKMNAIDEEATSLPDNKKKENRLKDLNDMKNKLIRELSQIEEMKEEKIILSSMITAKHKDKVWTVHGGNSDHLKFLNANYELYYNILLDAKAQGYSCVDFFGTEGKVDPKSEIYGIYLFKLRFGGDFDEFSGEFDFITKPLSNSIISLLLHIRRRYYYRKSLKQ